MTPRDLYDVLALRVAVFVVEQDCAYLELDGRDTEPDALHWWSRDDAGVLTASLRVLVEPGVGHRIGRVVTAPAARGSGAGTALMRAALDALPGPVVLGAQVRVAGLLRASRLRRRRARLRRGRHPARPDAQGVHRCRSGTGRIVVGVLTVLLFLLVVGGLIALAVTRRAPRAAGGGASPGAAGSVAADVDAEAEARRWYDRLGGQVLALTGTDEPSRQALADASERYTAAGSQLASATTPGQYRLVTDTALEGLHFVRAARTAMGMDPGPELPSSTDRARAGELSRDRTVDVEGRTVTGSPSPSAQNSHYYPGRLRGRAAGGGRLVLRAVVEADAARRGGRGRGRPARRRAVLRLRRRRGFDGGGFDGGFGGGWDGGGFGGVDGGGFDAGGLFDNW